MPDAKAAKKTTTPPPETEAPPVAEARPEKDEPARAPHELFWEAGQRLYQALQSGGEEARNRLASSYQEQWQHLCDVQGESQKRAEELRLEYWTALTQATGEDRNRIYQEATQKYQEGLWEIQTNTRKEWETAAANYQGALTSLQEGFQGTRITAFNAYKQACQRAWSEIDPNTLTCESLATIGQSLLMGARFIGGRPHAS